MEYTLTQEEYTKLQSKLKSAINSKDNDRIISTCDEALAIFEVKGYPDLWSDWERAKDDAECSIHLAHSSW